MKNENWEKAKRNPNRKELLSSLTLNFRWIISFLSLSLSFSLTTTFELRTIVFGPYDIYSCMTIRVCTKSEYHVCVCVRCSVKEWKYTREREIEGEKWVWHIAYEREKATSLLGGKSQKSHYTFRLSILYSLSLFKFLTPPPHYPLSWICFCT